MSSNHRTVKATQKFVVTETERIKKSLVHAIYHFDDERISQRYIQFHQQEIIRLLDSLRPSEAGLINILLKALEELLEFIKCHFTRYFDQDAKVPENYFARSRSDIQSNLPNLEQLVKERQPDPELAGIVFRILKQIIANGQTGYITYRRLIYAKEIQRELVRLTGPKYLPQDIDGLLRQLLLYLNYNSGRVLAYYARYFHEMLGQCETRREKIEKLSWLLKNINQTLVKPEIRYNPMAPPLKGQITEYLAQEIEYLEKITSINQTAERISDAPASGFKLRFEASVSQLAYLLKIFIDQKILVNSNVTQLLQFLVRYVITRHAETISYASFRAKFYNVEDGTKKAVRSMLVNMIQHIEKN